MKAMCVVAVGAVLGALGVMAGAFGAHALKARVGAEHLAVWKTAAEYHLLHAVLLIAIGALLAWRAQPAWHWAAALTALGVVLFSGSLYALVLLRMPILGAITPVGGSLLIAAWVCLAYGALRHG